MFTHSRARDGERRETVEENMDPSNFARKGFARKLGEWANPAVDLSKAVRRFDPRRSATMRGRGGGPVVAG